LFVGLFLFDCLSVIESSGFFVFQNRKQ